MTQRTQYAPNVLALAAAIVFLVGGGAASLAYIAAHRSIVFIEKSLVVAPEVPLASTTTGTLKAVYVHVGDTVPPNTVVATVGTELVKSIHGGLVVMVSDNVGKKVTPQDVVAKTIDQSDLRIVGQLEEDKGLSSVHVGQPALFTVDAFGGTEFVGVVDEVSPTSHQGDVVFSISDKRAVQSFDVRVRFDPARDPGFKNGMSAKMWIQTQ